MAITKGIKQIAEVTLAAVPFLKVSDIVAPHEAFKVVNYLPVDRQDAGTEEYFVIEAGRVVAISGSTAARFTGKLDRANGGVARTLTYAAADVNRTEDIDNANNLVTVAEDASTQQPANYPLGIVLWPVWQGTITERFKNFKLQDVVTVYNQAYAEYPMLRTGQTSGTQALVEGRLVMPDAVGQLVLWRNGTDSVDQIVGRCWQITTIAEEGDLKKVRTMTGLGLAGSDNAGIPQHLDFTHQGGAKATQKFRVVINCGL